VYIDRILSETMADQNDRSRTSDIDCLAKIKETKQAAEILAMYNLVSRVRAVRMQ